MQADNADEETFFSFATASGVLEAFIARRYLMDSTAGKYFQAMSGYMLSDSQNIKLHTRVRF